MKEVGRSDHSGDVVKKKSSSGCLIIKKKVTDGVGRVKGFSNSASRNLFNSTKEKKRPRVVRSDSESSDELSEPYRRKVDKFHNDLILYNREFMENRESEAEKRVNDGLDVFEFDEYDGFHERRVSKDVNDDRHRLKLHWQSGDQKESGSGSSRRIDDKKRDFYQDNRSTILDAKSYRPTHGIKSRYEMEDDESHLPLSILSERYREASDEPIRLQGKNGVLKVMVNKHKQMGVSHQSYDHAEAEDWKEYRPAVLNKKQLNVSHKSHDHQEAVDRKGSRSEDASKKKKVMQSSLYLDLKHSGKPVASKSKEKGELELTKPMLATSSKETDDSDMSLPLKSSSMRHCSTAKMVKNERAISPPTENVTPVQGKESKVRRGSGTEKQLLREKIRSMLLGAGWTIDYRPRRNRDYLDAVYISPTGTAYWSIIKAYEALQKEEEDHSKAGGDFTPLPVEILSKLTRQTRKKIEREMKKKRRDEGNSRNAKRDRMEVFAEEADNDQQEEKHGSRMKHGCKRTKSRLEETIHDSGDDSNDNSDRETTKQDRASKTTVGLNSCAVQGRKSRKLGRCTLLVRSSTEGLNSENDKFVPYSGKRTLLSWLINSGTVQMSEKVQYMNRKKTRVMQEGWITKDGIHCGCCSKILTVLKFELHAGSKLRQPFANIFVQFGQSLMQCQIDAWNKQGELERKGFHTVDVDGDDPNDDTCGLCGDGGDLICCDGCPSTFHQSCLDIQMLPQGDWHCPNCSCKYCEMASANCTEASVRTGSPVLMCCLCEKKYHESCSLEMDDKPTDPTDPNLSFCGQKCRELYSHLQKLLGVKHELDSGFSWSLIHRSDLLSNTSSVEFSQRVECNSKLAVALSVIDECFLPIVDRRSGINLIHNVVYNCGSNFSRLNYSGFFTAILERGDEMICAASIRIHGTRLAEMPFIGTRHIYRRQGMCRRLLSAIESVLSSLHIEKLIIPAIAEHMHTWTDVFGFSPLEESHKQEMRSMNMLVFPGTDMLQKPLVQQGTLVGNIISKKAVGKRSVEREGNMPKAENSELNSSDAKEFSEKIATTDPGSQDPSIPLDDGCSVDASDLTLCITSVKDDILLPVLAKKLEFVSGSIVHFDGDDTTMQNGEESTENSAHADAGSSDIPCKPEIQSVSLNAHSDSIVAKSRVQVGNETTDKIANADSFSQVPLVHLHKPVSSYAPCEPELQPSCSKVEEFAVQNGNVSTTTKTSDANSFQPQDPDVVHDTDSSDNPLLAKELVSLDAQSGSNAEEFGGQVSNVAIAKTTDASLFQPQVHAGPSSDIVSSYIAFESELRHLRKESVSVDALCVEEIALQNCTRTNLFPLRVPDVPSDGPCEPDLKLSGKESVSVDAHSDSKVAVIDVQNGSETTGKIADAIPLEAQVPKVLSNDAVSSYIPCEPELQLSGMESLHLDPHVAANVAEFCWDAGQVIPEIGKPPVQFSTGKGASFGDSQNKMYI